MTKFGALEKIEIFRQGVSRFAHVTFKHGQNALLALLQKPMSDKIIAVRLANAHKQPDNPLDESASPFQSLNADCLAAIFRFCNYHDQAILANVCRKFGDVLKNSIWKTKIKFCSKDAGQMCKTGYNILKSVGSKNFLMQLTAHPLLTSSFINVVIDLNFKGAKLYTESSFLEDFSKQKIVQELFHNLIVDYSSDPYVKVNDVCLEIGAIFPMVSQLTIVGPSNRHYLPIKTVKPWNSLENIHFENWSFCKDDYQEQKKGSNGHWRIKQTNQHYFDYVEAFNVDYTFSNCSLDARSLSSFLITLNENAKRISFVNINNAQFIRASETLYNLPADLRALHEVSSNISFQFSYFSRSKQQYITVYRIFRR